MKEEFDFYSKTSIKSYNLDESIRYQIKMLDGLDAYTRKHTEKHIDCCAISKCKNYFQSAKFAL